MITLRKDVDVLKFCRYDVFMVTESGIRATNVKPVGKREVVINMKGIHPNTRDDGVINYLEKYGKVVTNKVVYGVFTEGPLKGFKNSDRSYKIELKPNVNIGTYHALDGQKVTARYPGQQQTCARCFETPQRCPGRGMARQCDTAGGDKVEFVDYILKLWDSLGYSPEHVELAEHQYLSNESDNDNQDGEVETQVGGQFTPSRPAPLLETSFVGVSVKTFPRDADHGAITEILIAAGLPEESKDNVLIKQNGAVTISNLTNDISHILIGNLHQKKFLGRKIYCNGIVPLTPRKEEIAVDDGNSSASGEAASQAALNVQVDPVTNILINSRPDIENETNSSLLNIGCAGADIQQFVDENHVYLDSAVTPPAGSIAAEILSSPSFPAKGTLVKTKSLLSLRADVERSSEAGSCTSSLSSSGEESGEESENSEYKTMNDRQRGWKKKRKLSMTPRKEDLMKKLK